MSDNAPDVENNPVELLLIHNHWSTRALLDACETLTDEQFHHTFEMGLGSLHDTVTHILGAMRGWTDVLERGGPRVRREEAQRSAAELRRLLGEVDAELREHALSGPLDERIDASRHGRTFVFTRNQIVVHVTTHGVHHRAQALNMLRRLGAEPLPQSSVLEFTLAGGAETTPTE